MLAAAGIQFTPLLIISDVDSWLIVFRSSSSYLLPEHPRVLVGLLPSNACEYLTPPCALG